VLRYGYGYDFRGILVSIAVAIPLIHVALALLYMGIVLAGALSNSAWSTMGDIMVLAVNSSSTEHLRNTCAGVDKKETWGLVTRVRETSEEQLELILEGDDRDGGDMRE
jgi:hypothetical protein